MQNCCFLTKVSLWTLSNDPPFSSQIAGSFEALDFTKSQNGWGWKGPLEVSWFNPLLNQAGIQTAGCTHRAFDYLWRRKLHNFSGQPVNCLVTCTVMKCFLIFIQNLLHPLLLVLSVLKRAWFSPLRTFPSRIYRHWWDSQLRLSFPHIEQSRISQLFLIGDTLQSLHHLHGGLWMHSLHMSMSLLYWRAQNCTQYSQCDLIGAEKRKSITSFNILAIVCLNQPG